MDAPGSSAAPLTNTPTGPANAANGHPAGGFISDLEARLLGLESQVREVLATQPYVKQVCDVVRRQVVAFNVNLGNMVERVEKLETDLRQHALESNERYGVVRDNVVPCIVADVAALRNLVTETRKHGDICQEMLTQQTMTINHIIMAEHARTIQQSIASQHAVTDQSASSQRTVSDKSKPSQRAVADPQVGTSQQGTKSRFAMSIQNATNTDVIDWETDSPDRGTMTASPFPPRKRRNPDGGSQEQMAPDRKGKKRIDFSGQ